MLFLSEIFFEPILNWNLDDYHELLRMFTQIFFYLYFSSLLNIIWIPKTNLPVGNGRYLWVPAVVIRQLWKYTLLKRLMVQFCALMVFYEM